MIIISLYISRAAYLHTHLRRVRKFHLGKYENSTGTSLGCCEWSILTCCNVDTVCRNKYVSTKLFQSELPCEKPGLQGISICDVLCICKCICMSFPMGRGSLLGGFLNEE
jgi:hypothetical protein